MIKININCSNTVLSVTVLCIQDWILAVELCPVPKIIGVIYATLTMGAVRIDKYKEENFLKGGKLCRGTFIMFSRIDKIKLCVDNLWEP